MKKLFLVNNKKPELNALASNLISTWSNYGKKEPYWSVITQDEYTNKNINKNIDSFYESGKPQSKWILQEIINLIPDFNPEKILDYGCGVGRITKHFSNATGCDISQPHLEIAKKECTNEFILIEPGNCPKYYDLIYSLIVLQHNHPEMMKKCIYSILDSLTLKGIAFLHIPYSVPPMKNVNGIMEMNGLSKEEINEVISFQNCKLLKCFDVKMCGPDISDAIFIIQRI